MCRLNRRSAFQESQQASWGRAPDLNERNPGKMTFITASGSMKGDVKRNNSPSGDNPDTTIRSRQPAPDPSKFVRSGIDYLRTSDFLAESWALVHMLHTPGFVDL